MFKAIILFVINPITFDMDHIGWPCYVFEYLGCIHHREIWDCLGLIQVPQNNT